jgi:hypothetical protein
MSMLSETVTANGEWVLTLSDPAALAAEKEKLFLHKPLEKLGKNESGKECPPPPQ